MSGSGLYNAKTLPPVVEGAPSPLMAQRRILSVSAGDIPGLVGTGTEGNILLTCPVPGDAVIVEVSAWVGDVDVDATPAITFDLGYTSPISASDDWFGADLEMGREGGNGSYRYSEKSTGTGNLFWPVSLWTGDYAFYDVILRIGTVAATPSAAYQGNTAFLAVTYFRVDANGNAGPEA